MQVVKPGQCVRQRNSLPLVAKPHSLLWLRFKDPPPPLTTTTPPDPPLLIHVAAGTSRLINSEPTGESAAAQICIHLSEPREGRAQLSSRARNGDPVDAR